jgi:hypothetical protein
MLARKMRRESADFIGARSVSGCNKAGYKAATHPVDVGTLEKPSQTGDVHIRPLWRIRHGRCAHRNAGLPAVHGQPGSGARRRDGLPTSARNFPNRLGKNTNVYLGSAELAAICSRLGKIPTKEEYMADMAVLTASGDKIYQYMNFEQIEDFKEVADTVTM